MPKKPRLENADSETDTFNLELEGYTPNEDDLDGVTRLLKSLFPDGSSISASDLAQYIVEQNDIGTVLKLCPEDDEDEDDEFVFSVTSVINLSTSEVKKYPVIKSIRNFLLQHLKDIEDEITIKELLDENSAFKPFILINERFDTLPFSACFQALSSLQDELNKTDISPTHLILLALAQEDNGNYTYQYSEIKSVHKYASMKIKHDINILFNETEKNAFENNVDFNSLFLFVVPLSNISLLLDELKNEL